MIITFSPKAIEIFGFHPESQKNPVNPVNPVKKEESDKIPL